jgi:isopropylmalate/homocitrate/citramalate synthase
MNRRDRRSCMGGGHVTICGLYYDGELPTGYYLHPSSVIHHFQGASMRLENGTIYDYEPAARAGLSLPERVVLNDVTLREGIQAAQRPLDSHAKAKLGILIDQAGLPQIQVGYLGRSEMDRETLREMRGAGVRAALEGICSLAATTWEEEIDAAAAVSPDRLNVMIAASDVRIAPLKMDKRQVLARAVQGVQRARERCEHVCFSPVDTTRADLGFLKELLAAVTEAGADRYYLIDTAGVISPTGMRYLAREMVGASRIQLATHCHDDFGLAVANGLAAVEQGVQVVDVCVNGMGKRAGNLALEELALALTLFHNIDLGLRLERLYALAQATSELTGVPIPANKAIVGREAFEWEVDAQLRSTQGHRAVAAFDPEIVGYRQTDK